MKHLFKYESYSSIGDAKDSILDKIVMSGIKSLTEMELKFLKSFNSNDEESAFKELIKDMTEKVFVDDFGTFKFELIEIENYEEESNFIGILTFTDEFDQSTILKGKIVKYVNGNISPDFYDEDGVDIFELCSGLEYELDSFIEYVVIKISENYNIDN